MKIFRNRIIKHMRKYYFMLGQKYIPFVLYFQIGFARFQAFTSHFLI